MSGGLPARRTLVKVCGLTRLEDARVAHECGADWLGFVVHDPGPRRVSPERVREILAALPGAIGVAVMVAPTPDQALALATRAGARRVQLHRVEAEAWPEDFPLEVSIATPVRPDGRLAGTPPPVRHLVLLDTAHPSLAGGTGAPFAWERVAALAASRPVMLAGGLDPTNVGRAIAAARPFGVDASSRLERSPGIKDADKVRRFVAAVRESDEREAGVA